MTKALIIGAGMGGLAAALALHQQGLEVQVFEQAGALREVGAGLTLTRGALRSLQAIGMLDAVRGVSRRSASMPFVHYQTGRLLWGQFAGPEDADATAHAADAVDAAGNDALVARHIFRADLQAVLAQALQARSPGALRLGHSLIGLTQDAAGVNATFANGDTAAGDVLIGADGLHSAVRGALWGADQPSYTGQVAWRFLVDGALARPFLGAGRAAVFMGPARTFNRYTLRGGELLNCVALVHTPLQPAEGWAIPGDPAALAALFADWHPDVRALMALAEPGRLNKWALCARPPLAGWQHGRVGLLGDAAHPMLPFLGLGAAMAIEDAAILGRAFGLDADPGLALARYDAARRPRATAAADASLRQGQALQARDPEHFNGAATPVGHGEFFDYDPAAVAV